MKLNASAKPFSFNAGAAEWKPSTPAPAAAAAPAPTPAPAAAAAPAPADAEPKVYPAEQPVAESWEQEQPAEEPAKPEEPKKEAPAPVEKAAEAPKATEPENLGMEKLEVSSKKKQPKAEMKVHDTREHLNIVFIGHVDAGKSTISGQILLLTNQVDERTIQKYEKEAKEKNRESWYLAYVMDTNEEERNKGKTVEVGRAHFTTEKKRFTLLDAPGHKNYVPNMIEGTAQADVGVLVISARRGEFETGFERGGQTREHAMLAKTLGIQRLIVLVNKMDGSVELAASDLRQKLYSLTWSNLTLK